MNSEALLKSLGVNLPKGQKLRCIAKRNGTAVLEDATGQNVTVEITVFHRLVAGGFAVDLDARATPTHVSDEHERLSQAMKMEAIRRDAELRRAGKSAAESAVIIADELRNTDKYRRYVPAKFGLRTLQHWKRGNSQHGPSALIPQTRKRGNRGERYDELYEETALDVLEEIYLKNDRLSVGDLVAYVQKRYLEKIQETGEEPGCSGKRCLEAVLQSIRIDDIIIARHDTETARKLRLQAHFFHRVQLPFDLVEIDCTTADIFIVDQHGVCVGRPTICVAVDAVTGFPLAVCLSLDAPNESLTIAALKDVMTDRGDAFFDYYGIENRIEITGIPQIISSDQGSENSGPQLTALVERSGIEWGKNTPGCPEKKPHVERFFRELNRFLHTLPGSSYSKELPDKQRIEKGMLEAVMTLSELRTELMKWVYDVYARKLRRRIHSPLRVPETPTECWQRLSAQAICPPAPEFIRDWFMVQKTNRKLQPYGIEIEGIQYHSQELGELIRSVGKSSTVDVRYDPNDLREIVVQHRALDAPIVVPAKDTDLLAIPFSEAKRLRQSSGSAKDADRSARALETELAIDAQKLAESRGRGKVTSLKTARAKEATRQRYQEIIDRSKAPPRSNASQFEVSQQPTPKMPISRKPRLPAME